MARFWAMYTFHVRQYFRNSYFLWLVTLSALGLLMLKYLVAYSQGQLLNSQDVLISGIFGMWTSAVTAAGILHFQRSQGVLVYLVNSPTSSLVNLLALVSAPASFGLMAYPISYLAAGALNGLHFVNFKGEVVAYIALFWLSSLAITYLIAELFLLTKNAFVYEDLFVVPIMILSGLFSINNSNTEIMQGLGRLIPIGFPVQLLIGSRHFSTLEFMSWLLILLIWFAIAYFVFKSLIYKIRIKGEVEAM